MSTSDARGNSARAVLAGLGFLLGCTLLFWSVEAPIGAATAYPYRDVQFVMRDGGQACRSVQRGERVSIWPGGAKGGEALVRLVGARDCFAPLSNMSARPRPALRPVKGDRWRFAIIRPPDGRRPSGRVKRYTTINARREPDLDGQFIIEELDSPEAIHDVVGEVTGTDDKDWLEVVLSTGQTAYIKRYLLEMI